MSHLKNKKTAQPEAVIKGEQWLYLFAYVHKGASMYM